MKQFLVIVITLLLTACHFFDNEYHLDLNEPSTFILHATDKEAVSGFRLRATGYYSGEGILELYLEGSVYKRQEIKGKVNFSWGGDWYHPNMKLVYRVKKQGEGKLRIKYKIGYALL